MRIAFVTSTFPFGTREPFLAPEVSALRALGHSVVVVPMRPGGEAQRDADLTPGAVVRRGLVDTEIIRTAMRYTPGVSDLAWTASALRRSGSFRKGAKNLAVLAKAFWLARLLKAHQIDHVHCHWGGCTATLAMLASRYSGVPWSMTLHRWDITENNMLSIKCSTASFVRVISASGADMLAKYVPNIHPAVIGVGVDIRELIDDSPPNDRIVVIASLIEGKGHLVLLSALSEMSSKGLGVATDIVGDGPLRSIILERIEHEALGDVRLLGHLTHDHVISRLRAGEWGICVLPSTGPEGIPVALLEALEARVACVATDVGGVRELLGQGAGRVVPPGDASALSRALASLLSNSEERCRLASAGRAIVAARHDAKSVATQLSSFFMAANR